MTPVLSVREFLIQAYRLINASNPTVPMLGDDEVIALRVLNWLFQSYSSSGLLTPIAKTVSVDIFPGQNKIIFTDSGYPTTTSQIEIVNLTLSSAVFNVVNGNIYQVGAQVSGLGIPLGATIVDITANTITISAVATLTGLSSLTFVKSVLDPTAAYINQGRLANLDSAWLLLSGVTYPLIDKSRDVYLGAWKYEPLQGLPRFIITMPDTDVVSATLYPAPSQYFQFNCRGKFKLEYLSINDDMSNVPDYYHLYFMYAVMRQASKFNGRGSAWTQDLEAYYQELKLDIEGASEVNLTISGDEESMLNGAYRIRAGI